MLELYRGIWSASKRAQLIVIALSITVAGLAAVPLQFQKSIINGLTEGTNARALVLLCAGYLAVLAVTSSLRFAMRFRISMLGESLIRRIRKSAYGEHSGATAPAEEKRETLVAIVVSEAEEVGRFAGDAIASPILQIGTLLSVVAFVATTQPYLGLFLIAVVLPQAVIVLSLQKSINERIARRIKLLRGISTALGPQQIKQTQQAVLDDFDRIYEGRRQTFRIKLTMKLALNLINGLGTVGILLVGGLLYLDGRTDVGTVVASLSALVRMNEPWRALIAFYRELSAVRLKFDLLVNAGN
ncbi:MAG: ABC transporter ATP-binding protein [Alphaproteobacteria bacterium]|nr:ABC transporter ATP-binding protein [Alphaproteobacteria bacterium]